MRNYQAFQALFKRAVKGGLTREEWIRGNAKLEYGALRRTAARYDELWRPLAHEKGFVASGHWWGADTPPTYEDWISRYNDPKSYPWDIFGAEYDRGFLPSRGIR